MLWLVVGAAAGLAWIVRDHLTTPYDALFDTAGAKHKVPSNLLRAIAWWESRGSFNASAVSPENSNGSRDYGLMQINSRTLAAYGLSVSAALSPATSIDTAARLLVEIRKTLGPRFSAFTWPMAYNVGPDLAPHAAGQVYASQVLWHWQLYDLGRALAPPARSAA